MTINLADNNPRISYTVNAGVTQTTFAVPFEFFVLADLNVYVDGVKKSATTHYTLASGGDGSTGTINLSVTGITGNSTVVITRDIAIERTTDFQTSGPFAISVLNVELDKIIAILADLDDAAQRALILPDSDPTSSITLPSIDTRKNKVLSFDAAGALVVSQTIGTSKGTDATVTTVDYLKHDIIKSTTAAQLNNVYIAIVDTSAGDTLTDTNKFMLLVDSVTASQAATNAAASATTAQGHANTATTKAGEASASATVSENYAVKTDGAVPSTSDHSSKAWAVGGTGVTDTAGAGAAKQWAVDQTADGVDGTEFSAKEYAIGVQQTVGSAKQWAIGGGGSFSTNTPVAGGVFSAKYYAELAAASADSFDDVYLGPKSSDPTQDNDGDALNAGDLYYNTNSTTLRVFTGSAWEDAVVSTSGFATAGFSIAMSIAL